MQPPANSDSRGYASGVRDPSSLPDQFWSMDEDDIWSGGRGRGGRGSNWKKQPGWQGVVSKERTQRRQLKRQMAAMGEREPVDHRMRAGDGGRGGPDDGAKKRKGRAGRGKHLHGKADPEDEGDGDEADRPHASRPMPIRHFLDPMEGGPPVGEILAVTPSASLAKRLAASWHAYFQHWAGSIRILAQ